MKMLNSITFTLSLLFLILKSKIHESSFFYLGRVQLSLHCINLSTLLILASFFSQNLESFPKFKYAHITLWQHHYFFISSRSSNWTHIQLSLTFRTFASLFIIKDSSRSSSSSKSSIGMPKGSIMLQHLEPSSLGSKGSTIMGSVPFISQRQKGHPWPSDSWRNRKCNHWYLFKKKI